MTHEAAERLEALIGDAEALRLRSTTSFDARSLELAMSEGGVEVTSMTAQEVLDLLDAHEAMSLRLTAALTAHAAELAGLRAALEEAANQFAEYARQHRAKEPPQHDKAQVNDKFEAMCRATALSPPKDPTDV